MLFFFFFNDTATTEIYTLSLHDALPILIHTWGTAIRPAEEPSAQKLLVLAIRRTSRSWIGTLRSEEHTSELQSLTNLVCRLLLEKKINNRNERQRLAILCCYEYRGCVDE